MITSKTPFRVSLAGGGTDIKNYYSKYGGQVVSFGINRYVYVTVSKRDDDNIVVSYSEIEKVKSVSDIKHSIIRECLKEVGITKGIEIHIISDFSVSSGLGGSSAVTVGVLNALYNYQGHKWNCVFLADKACKIEIDILKKCIGKQDQYGSAMGGLNRIYFEKDGSVPSVSLFRENFFKGKLFLTEAGSGKRVQAENILLIQNDRFDKNEEILHKMKEQCGNIVQAIMTDDVYLVKEIINQGWEYKKQLSPYITTDIVDKKIDYLLSKGCGAKLCGAGHSGYIMIFNPDGVKLDLPLIPIEIDTNGSSVIEC